jgi:hypothetical protein
MNDKCLLSSTGLLTALDKRPAARLARGYDGANLLFVLSKFRQKEKLIIFKIKKKWFWRFSIARCKKNDNKKSLIFLYLVFSVWQKI